MTELSSTELEIVGFDGVPSVECGRALPVARRKSDGAHTVLDLTDGAARLNWRGEGEAASLRLSGRWTRFEGATFVPQSCRHGQDYRVVNQPMVIYADESMLDTADRLPRPPLLSGEYMIWRRLESHPKTVQAACASEAAVEKLLNDWGQALLDRFDAMYRIGRDRQYLKRIADFALCAARTKELRWRAYLFFSTVQDQDRVQGMFDTFIQREFPATNWEEFISARGALRDSLGSAPSLPTPAGPPASGPSTARSKLRGIASRQQMSEEEMFAQ